MRVLENIPKMDDREDSDGLNTLLWNKGRF
jgi:hypothetical protein